MTYYIFDKNHNDHSFVKRILSHLKSNETHSINEKCPYDHDSKSCIYPSIIFTKLFPKAID